MPDLAVLESFRRLARTAPFTRNVDALFKDFFLAPMSLDSTATGQLPLDATEEGTPQPASAALDGVNPASTPDSAGLSQPIQAQA